ncbi:LysR substrate binding domain-containing protein [Microbacterium sp. cf046]|uniref:LysR family substrate-binding domain-containing protein n=1 Tax=Microbacterium sp. cf046 TaxID=1761803 RepID=UPI0008F29E98|nr:LysR family substrate-binding domain-containing protein [Microbacterium sp. cf046]SFR93869.1 LysR substrate binding domain-containing protein [Microbacterium sp. cf046]
MAKGGGARGRQGRPGKSPGAGRAKKDAAPRRPGKPSTTAPRGADAPPETARAPTTFVLGAIPGATPGGWIDAWNERMPHTEFELRPIAVATQRDTLREGVLDAALVRLPIDGDGLHIIPLYDEVSVVVSPADSHLTAADELELADLAGEILIVPHDDVLALDVPGAVSPSFAAPEDTEQAIATVAAGVGIVIVPMSLARLHRRKDAAYRPLRDAPTSTVALAWPAERTTPSVETFVGIVRGRTANSSRS